MALSTIYESVYTGTQIDEAVGATATNTVAINNHIDNKSNPHSVTKAQVGLGNVNNTSDADKPISTAVQTALDTKANQSALNTTNAAVRAAQTTADEAKAIAEGRNRARVFGTKAEMDEWLGVEANVKTLMVGDVFYIEEAGTPDYWWNGVDPVEMESHGVDLSNYYTKTQVNTLVNAKYTKPSNGIPLSDLASTVQTSIGLADTAYQLPTTGIPLNNLTSSVRVSLAKADTALQSVPNATTTTRGIVLLGASGGAATYAATNAKYTKPSAGIPKSDLASAVQASLDLADSAVQSVPTATTTVAGIALLGASGGAARYGYKADVGLSNVDNVKQYSASNPPPYPVTSVAGKTGVVTLAPADVGVVAATTTVSGIALLGATNGAARYGYKADVGLGNVDNTSDANKPISTATQTALNAKANSSTVTALASRVAALETLLTSTEYDIMFVKKSTT